MPAATDSTQVIEVGKDMDTKLTLNSDEKSEEPTKVEANDKENSEPDSDPATALTCNYCHKAVASASVGKRCSKRHPKCMKKLWCNESCEKMGHPKSAATLAAEQAKKQQDAAKKKKAAKNKNQQRVFEPSAAV